MALKKTRLEVARFQLQEALTAYQKTHKQERDLPFLTVAKAFEVLVEYAWKELKHRVEEEGLDAPSPKSAIRESARLGIIVHPEEWMASINARNDSVHNYFSIPEEDYLELANNFLTLTEPLVQAKAKS